MAPNSNNSPEAWVQAGIAYDQAGRPIEALAAYDHALALDPTFIFAWNYKGMTLRSLGPAGAGGL